METACELSFADGKYRFWLPLPQAIELERKLETPITVLSSQLESCIGTDEQGGMHYIGGGGITITAVRHIIRLALIGGNCGIVDGEEQEVGPMRASDLVDAYVYPQRPLAESMAIAAHILFAAIHGIRLKKKAEDEAEEASSSIKEP